MALFGRGETAAPEMEDTGVGTRDVTIYGSLLLAIAILAILVEIIS
ncbi:MAG: hypothetical protein ACM33U_02330 [Solirubrobacterales bacterium]